MTAAIINRPSFFYLKPNFSHDPMNENRAKQAGKKSASTYLILTAVFVIIFGGITLLGIFIAHLSS
jgi:hypothetical protein